MEARIYVSYAQLAVFNVGLDNPFNDWSQRHVQQGFAWRPGSVSFGMLFETGDIALRIIPNDEIEAVGRRSSRAIRVPFEVTPPGRVEIASITESVEIEIEPRAYSLSFYLGGNDVDAWCCLNWLPDAHCEPEILIRDDDLSPVYPLLMDARPA